ncbi:MAG: Sapep family Mn(2+)-dependent dipeptidase [Oscillospiraceae bacterium]|nr:Sapep family Mn(2+)-dependent dipeptidase [Oscillospiraceae bacterium]
MNNNKNAYRDKIDQWYEAHTNDMLKDLGRLIAINSVKTPEQPGAPYGSASREVLSLAGTMLEKQGFAVQEFENIMLTSDLGPNPPLLGILAHLDIVEAGEGWDTDPFEMAIKDGVIYGRGIIDNKGPAVASMYAMYCARELCPNLKHGVRLILGSGEETGFDDVTKYLAKNAPPPNVFSPDAEFPVVNTEKGRFCPFFGASWEKDDVLPRVISITGGKTTNIVPNRAEAEVEGFAKNEVEAFCRAYSEKTGATLIVGESENGKLTISAEGTATHAATPELGNNAQTALIEMLAAMPFAQSKSFGYVCSLNRLFAHNDYNGRALGIEMSDKKSGKLTVNFGVLRFTEYEFSANFDSRTPACADEVDITGITKSAFANEHISVTESTISQCHHTPEDGKFVQTLLKIYEEYTGNEPGCLTMGGQTYVHDIPGGVVFGCGFPGVNYNAHGPNEFMTVDQLLISAKMFTQVIIDMCG